MLAMPLRAVLNLIVPEEVTGESFVADFNFLEGLYPSSVWLLGRGRLEVCGGSEEVVSIGAVHALVPNQAMIFTIINMRTTMYN